MLADAELDAVSAAGTLNITVLDRDRNEVYNAVVSDDQIAYTGDVQISLNAGNSGEVLFNGTKVASFTLFWDPSF